MTMPTAGAPRSPCKHCANSTSPFAHCVATSIAARSPSSARRVRRWSTPCMP
ncbi:MAG TPA: hypothetical protein DIC37_14130 [Pseudomonas sp.]|nr:hypothetical protein [Pseudomonas sp.]